VKRGPLPFVAVVVVGLILLLFLSEPASDWLAGLVIGERNRGAEVGKVVTLEGELKRISDGRETVSMGPLSSPLPLYNGDRLELSKDANAVVILKSQDELQISNNANLAFQLWDEHDAQSPVYVTIQQGKVELAKAGIRGRAYLVREGRLYLPGQSAQPTRSTLVLNRSEVDLNMAENQLQDDGEKDSNTSDVDPPVTGPTPETLSNEYIDETITRRQMQLQKCWLNRVRENPVQKGKIVVQFEISRRGKIKDVRVTDSDLNDPSLNSCITGVIERISFRSFKGAEISLSYPIQFE
jgi:hypothetical protein